MVINYLLFDNMFFSATDYKVDCLGIMIYIKNKIEQKRTGSVCK